jgi:dienelactone hydrolase
MTRTVTKKYFSGIRNLASTALVALWLIGSSAFGAEAVSFQGTSTHASGDPVRLTGKLTKPQGDGPFPAIVLSHGCSGIMKYNDVWAERFAKWGYVALQVDHFGPRGVTELCGRPRQIPFAVRAHDVYDAKAFLGGLPFVDRSRIALMGWSQGGITTLSTVSKANYDSWIFGNPPWKQQDAFRAAIAFYPYCNKNLEDTNAPLLILVGERDTWTPASMCRFYMPERKTPIEIILKLYPDAYHGFDSEGLDEMKVNHRVLSNPEALADSIIQVQEFLAKHLK